MDVTITFRHSEPSQAVRQEIEDRIQRMSKYLMKATQAHVILNVEKSRHIAEITLQENQHTLYARSDSHDMCQSVDDVIDKLVAQARKLKEKVKDHHPHYRD